MIPRLAGGWQTTIADLALILFIVSVAGLQSSKADNADNADEAEIRPSAQGEAVAVYRADYQAPPIGEWLAEQTPDQRQQLTIVARYRPGDIDVASRKALELAHQAGEKGRSARIVLEQGAGGDTLALLAFDMPSDAVAQSLQGLRQD